MLSSLAASKLNRSPTKPAANNISVASIRNPSRMEEMGDTGFGTLNESKDGMVVSYDNSTDRFILISADDLLETSVEDSDLPDTFISALESEIDLAQIMGDLDGGAW